MDFYGAVVGMLWGCRRCGDVVGMLWGCCGDVVGMLWGLCGDVGGFYFMSCRFWVLNDDVVKKINMFVHMFFLLSKLNIVEQMHFPFTAY